MTGSVDFRLPNAANGTEALLEFVDPSFGIDELGQSGEEGMRVGRDADRDEAVFHAVDHFLLLGSLGRAGDETFAGGHVNEDDRIVFRMKILFHGNGGGRHVTDATGRGMCGKSRPCQAGISETGRIKPNYH